MSTPAMSPRVKLMVAIVAGVLGLHVLRVLFLGGSFLPPIHGSLLSAFSNADIEHPIPVLMAQAQARFEAKVARQSKTFPAFVKEYKRRYGRPPPEGIDKWWEFAQNANHVMVDEYDQLVSDLEPFMRLPGAEVRRRADQIGTLNSVNVVRFKDGDVSVIYTAWADKEDGSRARGVAAQVQKFKHELPDMAIPINTRAEGRVLVPWEEVHYPNATTYDTKDGIAAVLGFKGDFKPDWRGDGNVWESFRRTCDPSSQARRLFTSMRAQLSPGQRPLNRLSDLAGEVDAGEDFTFDSGLTNFSFCDFPSAHYQQGHFFSDWRTINALYPIFSHSKGPGYADIIIPSHYYYSPTSVYTYGFNPKVEKIPLEIDPAEVPWEDKISKVFWRGATTGGGSSPPGFTSNYQRHRLLRLASDPSPAPHTVVYRNSSSSDKPTTWDVASLPGNELNKAVFDVAFTTPIGCASYENGGCEGLRRVHRFANKVPLGENWKYKYLIDLDGMGYSGRFLALMSSYSAVLKTTVYKEFFSEWIEPWVHYIPISYSYKEIYNVYSFFTGLKPSLVASALDDGVWADDEEEDEDEEDDETTVWSEEGDRLLERIGRAGREWKYAHARNDDIEVYMYRLLLEWARIYADDRESMTYQG